MSETERRPEPDENEDLLVTPATSIDGSRTSGRITMLAARDSEEDSRPQRLRLVGKGGHGEVWLVRYLGSEEVWKYIPLHTSEEARAFREALHSRRVEHTNVVRVFDVFRQDENYVLRMEYVPGRDLFRVVREDGILDAREVVRIALQVAQALSAAHAQNIVHLDLKPQNLILRDDGQVMLTDFGISASVLQESTEGVGRGTPFFMAPEQIDGRSRLDPAVDVWAFGVTLYFLASGEYPFAFDDRDYREVILRDEPIPLRERQPVLDDALWQLVRRCLEKDAAERFPSIDAVQAALLELRDGAACPACGRRAPATDEDVRCAHCGWVTDAAQRRLGDVFLDGQARFSGADFRGAERCFLEVRSDAAPELVDLRARAAAAARASREASDELAEVLRTVRDAVERDQYLDAFRRSRACPARFSRSKERKTLEAEILIEIRRRCTSVRSQVERLVRAADFDEARRQLDEVEGFLSHPPLRALLLEEGQGAFEDYTGSTSEIYRTITEREEICRRHTEAAEAALQALDLDAAKRELGALYHWFHGREHLDRIRELNRAAESLEIVRQHALEPLDALERTRTLPDGVTLELDAAHRHCVDLVRAFPPALYPRMEEFEACRKRLEVLLPELRQRGRTSLAQARLAEIAGNVVDALDELRDTSAFLLRTDLFTSEEQEEARRILRVARERTQKADVREREGLQALEGRRYAQAIAAFEEASALDPRRADRWNEPLHQARDASAVALRLADEVQPLYFSLVQRPPRIDDLVVYLRKVARLWPLQDEAGAEESRQRSAEVFARGMASVSARLADCVDVREAAAIFEEFHPVMLAAVETGLLPVLLEAPAVRSAASDLVKRLLDACTTDADDPLEQRCERYAEVLDLLEGWKEFLRNVTIQPAARERGAVQHPIQSILAALRDEADRGLRAGREGVQSLMLLQGCVQRAGQLMPREHRDLAERVQMHLRLRAQTLRLRGMVRSSLRFAVSVGVPVLLVVAAAVGVLTTHERDERERRVSRLLDYLSAHGRATGDWPVGRVTAEWLIDAPGDRALLQAFLESDLRGFDAAHEAWSAASTEDRAATLERLVEHASRALGSLAELHGRGIVQRAWVRSKQGEWSASVRQALASTAGLFDSTHRVDLVLDRSLSEVDQEALRRLEDWRGRVERRRAVTRRWALALARRAEPEAPVATSGSASVAEPAWDPAIWKREREALAALLERWERETRWVDESERLLQDLLRAIDVSTPRRSTDVPTERELTRWVESSMRQAVDRADQRWIDDLHGRYLALRERFAAARPELGVPADGWFVDLVDRCVLMHQLDALVRVFEQPRPGLPANILESEVHRRSTWLARTSTVLRARGTRLSLEIPGLRADLQRWLVDVVLDR